MKKFLVCIFIIFLFLSSALLRQFLNKQKQEKEDKFKVQEEQELKAELDKKASDTTLPILRLRLSKMTITVNSQINYESLILEATDNLDGDIMKSIVYNTIDTSIPGNYTITYCVKDSARNETKVELAVHVVKDYQLAK